MSTTNKRDLRRRHANRWEEMISPADYRYWDEEAARFLSVEAGIEFQLLYQQAIVKVHCDDGVRPRELYPEFAEACQKVKPSAVYREEERIRHDVQALVNEINRGASNNVKAVTNLAATSYDTISTADSARYKAFIKKVLLPAAHLFLLVLIEKVQDHAQTIQMGRTHLQHATPITLGFAFAWHLDRIGGCVEEVRHRADQLIGKYSGPVGTKAGLWALPVSDPARIELEVLRKLNLVPGRISSQIIQPEPLARLLFETTLLLTALANFAEDLRLLSMTEIGEISEPFGTNQVGSAGMPHKDSNPISFENTYGQWITVMPRIVTVLLTMISNHQRDLRNSMPMRTFGETFGYAYAVLMTMTKSIKTLKVNKERCLANFQLKGDLVLTELVKIILMEGGHPNAYKVAQQLAREATANGQSLYQTFKSKRSLKRYFESTTPEQLRRLEDPKLYIGSAALDAWDIAEYWQEYCKGKLTAT